MHAPKALQQEKLKCKISYSTLPPSYIYMKKFENVTSRLYQNDNRYYHDGVNHWGLVVSQVCAPQQQQQKNTNR